MSKEVKPLYNERPLEKKFVQHDWYKDVLDHLHRRFPAIADRMYLSFRYVDLHPINKDSFSYEYASIIRDVGSIFSSVMDKILLEVKWPRKRANYNIMEFRDFLLKEISDLEHVIVFLKQEKYDYRLVVPFKGFSGNKITSVWWAAFGNLKHSDIENIEQGCLSNALYAFCALASLYQAINPSGNIREPSQGMINDIGAHPQLGPFQPYFFPPPTKYEEWIK